MDKRQKAKESLVWYFQLIAERAGVRWSEDNSTEVEAIIDDILDAAAEARAEIAKGATVSAALRRLPKGESDEWLIHTIGEIAERAAEGLEPGTPLFDQLAEEVMELHLALRGKHSDTPAMEWLEIATIAVNALRDLPIGDVDTAIRTWQERHGRG